MIVWGGKGHPLRWPFSGGFEGVPRVAVLPPPQGFEHVNGGRQARGGYGENSPRDLAPPSTIKRGLGLRWLVPVPGSEDKAPTLATVFNDHGPGG